tara:strand:- start:107 stop:484 length:378 start_codon:yes stop_codon:yes gene_type:complete
MNKPLTKTSIDTSVSLDREIQILKQHPMVKEYLLLEKKQRAIGSLIRGMIKDEVHVQGVKVPKAIVRPSDEWSDNARFVMRETSVNNTILLHGLRTMMNIRVVPTRARKANFMTVRSYPTYKVQS